MKANKAPTKVFSKYVNFADVFSQKLIAKLSKHTRINNYAIESIDNQQLLYSSIYNPGPMELEILKTYIKNNLANGFIKPLKSPVEALIFFNKKSNKSLRLYINY